MKDKSVDIILVCYKQERYIEQALRSIYAQELPSDVTARIIVADDCSPDDTLNIIKRLAPESPFPLVFLPEEPNMGISKNYGRSFAATTADYVAILEGDDYWLPGHLLQHLKFHQEHPNFSLSMNVITEYNEDADIIDVWDMFNGFNDDFKVVTLHQQIAEGNKLGNLSACMFRGQYLRDIPVSLYDIIIADWMLGIMVAQHGDIGLLGVSTSIYRTKASGVWAGRSQWQQSLGLIQMATLYDNYLGKRYHADWKMFKRKCRHDIYRMAIQNMLEYIKKFRHKVIGNCF